MQKPQLSFWQIWNMCFGFLGIQFGFALQNANVSRIFQTLGAEVEQIPLLWIAAPLTGLIVQPIVGHCSDKTWTKLGRRRPYFLYGAILTSLSLLFMPHSPGLWMAAGALWVLDASINITMEPFRAFVGDNLNKKQRTLGYAMQSFFIGVGAIVASAMPWILSTLFEVSNTATEGQIPDAVRYSFYYGAAVLLVAVLWTVFNSKEYSPEELATFEQPHEALEFGAVNASFSMMKTGFWIVGGFVSCGLIYALQLEAQLYLLGAAAVIFGLMQLIASTLAVKQQTNNGFYDVVSNLNTMPVTMRKLAWVQFFSWFALFAMWIYTTAAVTEFHFGSSDPLSEAFNRGANWVGVLFAAYNGFAALTAVFLPVLSKHIGNKATHQLCLSIGALGLMSFLWITNPTWLLLSMFAVGVAWCSILAIPYALLADSLPTNKMGVYMGIFNFFIVIPQLLAATILGLLIKYFFNHQAIYALAIGAACWIIAALLTQRLQEH